MLFVAGPNILWNLMNELATVRHLGDNAISTGRATALAAALPFSGAVRHRRSLVFALMFGFLRRRAGDTVRALLLCLSVPVILVIMAEAFSAKPTPTGR